METNGAGWVDVAEYTNHPEADLARNLLESNGVTVHVWADDCGGLAVGQTFVQRVRLFVPPDDESVARDLMKPIRPDEASP